jgi:hypothetical protein
MPKPKKYFREEVSRLINKYYRTEVSKSEIKDYESKYIEYAANGDFDIYVLVATDGWSDYFKMCKEDLHRFVVRPRGIINIGELKLYTVASEELIFIYYDVIVPEHGDDGDIPEVSKKCEISTRLFRIKEEDLILLEEVIERDCQLDLKVKQGEGKTEKNNINFEKDIKPNPIFMDNEKNVLYFNKENPVTLKPEEIKLIEYLCKQDAFELEQILTDHFKIKLTGTYKHSKNIDETITKPTMEDKGKAIDKGDRNKFDVYKTNINKKCKLLEIGDLIIRHEKLQKAFKLSINIKKKPLKL